jgi:hypothetical protein
MATRIVAPEGANSPSIVADELIIGICPRGYDKWEGTRAQLVDEGLISAEFEWPEGLGDRLWNDGPFVCWLRRYPKAHMGPKSSWAEIDYWYLQRTWKANGRDNFSNARIFEKQAALAREIWNRTRAGQQQFNRAIEARVDRRFQLFMTACIPARKKPGRKRGGKEGSQVQS